MKWSASKTAIALVDDSIQILLEGESEPRTFPAYVALRSDSKEITAWGQEALYLKGNEPPEIEVGGVLRHGFPSDFELFESYMQMVYREAIGSSIVKPVCVVSCLRESAGRRILREVLGACGFREIFLFDQPMAAAVGSEWPTYEDSLRGILTIDRDWFEFGVFAQSSMVGAMSGPVGIDTFSEELRARTRFSTTADSVDQTDSLLRIAMLIEEFIEKLSKSRQQELRSNGLGLCVPSSHLNRLREAFEGLLSVPVFAVEPDAAVRGCASILSELRFLKKAASSAGPPDKSQIT